jgi:fatty-acyl-CoA synthase
VHHYGPMYGLMQDVPLTVESILRRGDQYYGDRTVVTRTVSGLTTGTFSEVASNARRLASALDGLGLAPDARVATFGWNTQRHLELYFAVPSTGRILHTLNIRLFPAQLRYIIDHAQDEAVFVDRSLLPLLAPHLPDLRTVRHVIVMDDGADHALPDDPRVVTYDQIMAGAVEADLEGRVADERQAAALCYTSGTTGDPKGVLYSHRSTWLHSLTSMSTGAFALGDRDTILPVVPMFHVNAWGIPYTALMAGSNLVMPGPILAPAAILDLLESQRVTVAAGVPTIWMGMLPLTAGRDLSSLRTIISGGSATPPAMADAYRDSVGVRITTAWGMTETSPLGAICRERPELDAMDEQDRSDILLRAGIAPPGVELRIVAPDSTEPLPWDDEASGELQARGPWIASQYYGAGESGSAEAGGGDTADKFTEDGWLRTGDVATISRLCYIRLVDRTKDLVKSGGEWISSVDLENAIMGHPAVAEAAVIGLPHPKWSERPMACVVLRPGAALDQAELLDYLRTRVASWWLPDEVVFLAEIPKTSVGKFSKKTLREQFAGHVLPTA